MYVQKRTTVLKQKKDEEASEVWLYHAEMCVCVCACLYTHLVSLQCPQIRAG